MTLRIRITDAYGSFNAWGIGLCYEYDNRSQQLSIIHARRYKPILDIDLDLQAADNPKEFISYLEKATQIHALMLSNNSTVDVTEILGIKKLQSYLENTLVTATMALLLNQDEYAEFSEIFCDRYNLRSLSITITESWVASDRLFITNMETERGNKAGGQGFYLHNSLFSLSKNIVSDLIITEINNNIQSGAHTLLTASSKLSTLSLMLNPRFEPRRRIVKKDENPQRARVSG